MLLQKRMTHVFLAGASAVVGGVAPGFATPASAACPSGAALHVSQPFVGTGPPQVHAGYTCYDIAGQGGHVGPGAVVVLVGPSYGVYADLYHNTQGTNEFTGGNQVTVQPPLVVPSGCAVDIGSDGVCDVPGVATTPVDVHVRLLGLRYL